MQNEWINPNEQKLKADETVLLLSHDHYGKPLRTMGYYDSRGNTFWNWIDDDIFYPEWWMPFPESPENEDLLK